MKIHHVLQARHLSPITIQFDMTALDAAHLMTEHKIGAVIVVDRHFRPVGIVSERDITHMVSQKKSAATTAVRDIMSPDLVVGHMDDDVQYIMHVITQKRIRHIPIVEDGILRGIISIGDVLKTELKETQVEVRYLRNYIESEPYHAV